MSESDWVVPPIKRIVIECMDGDLRANKDIIPLIPYLKNIFAVFSDDTLVTENGIYKWDLVEHMCSTVTIILLWLINGKNTLLPTIDTSVDWHAQKKLLIHLVLHLGLYDEYMEN
jgi:hypothetical protein